MKLKLSGELKNSFKAAEKEFKEEPMKQFYENRIAGYPSRLRVKKILKELGNIKGKKVIDIGCEAGYISLKILEKQPSDLYAIDIIEDALKEFKKKLINKEYETNLVIKKAPLQKIPFQENFFDIAVCTEVIEHAPNIIKGFDEMARVLKKGGLLFLTFPNEKLRKKVYPIVKLLGVNTDIEKEVTLFEYNPKDIIKILKKNFIIKKFDRLPWFFPITNFIVCEKR